MKYKVYLEYDGTNYSGWQVQKNAKTVQGTLIRAINSAFSKSRGESKLIDVQGSGRTDSGVHAIEQVAHIDCKTMLSAHILKFKINDELPTDINILKVEKALPNFHARHSAISRQYLYRISRRRTAFEKRFVWWIKDELDTAKMKEAGNLFAGMHDFRSFAEPDPENKSTKVLVNFVNVFDEDDLILIRVNASHFLWKMVRRMVGVIAEAGKRKFKTEDVKEFLDGESPEPAKLTAPPSGLFLEKVYYE